MQHRTEMQQKLKKNNNPVWAMRKTHPVLSVYITQIGTALAFCALFSLTVCPPRQWMDE